MCGFSVDDAVGWVMNSRASVWFGEDVVLSRGGSSSGWTVSVGVPTCPATHRLKTKKKK